MIATIAAIQLAKTFSNCCVIVTVTAIIWTPAYMETAQRSKCDRGSDRSDRSDHISGNQALNVRCYVTIDLCHTAPC